MSSTYHSCARTNGQCVGLKKGLKGYHKCARDSKCKKSDREKVEDIRARMKISRAKATVKKAIVQKKKKKKAEIPWWKKKPKVVAKNKAKRKAKAKPQKSKITQFMQPKNK